MDPFERPARDLVEAIIDTTLSVLESYLITRAGERDPRVGTTSVANALALAGHNVCCVLHSIRQHRGRDIWAPVFQSMCSLAAAVYESRRTTATIVFRPDPPLAPETASFEPAETLSFQPGTSLAETRPARKLIEIAGDDAIAVSNGWAITGIDVAGRVGRNEINAVITGPERWELRRGHVVIMDVERGRPRLPRPELDAGPIGRFLAQYVGKRRAAKFAELVVGASKAPHGALVVFDADAQEQAGRLSNSAQLVRPTPLDAATIRAASRIDGAVIINFDGMCFAIGAILDGLASDKGGSRGRGARYNSADRFVRYRAGKAIAFVLSEDRTCDVFAWDPQRGRVEPRSVPNQLFTPIRFPDEEIH